MEGKKLRVDIWSDVVCPFCYIGKRKFESALGQFEHRDDLEVVWHSFQLFPNYEQQNEKDFYQTLAEIKGQNRDWSVNFHNQLAEYAKQVGLEFNFDSIPFPNTFKAHRFTHLAKNEGLQAEAEEHLFHAYFTKSRNIDNTDVLLEIAGEIGLDKVKVCRMLESDLYEKEVKEDFEAAQTFGIHGVPYFLINNKVAVAGAQSPQAFIKVLESSWNSWNNDKTSVVETGLDGLSCSSDGHCS